MAVKAIFSEKLALHLKQIDSGSISESQLSELVQISRAMIQAHLTCIRSSVTQLCLQQGLTIVDLSYDCIADAFAHDTDNRFRNIHNFVGSLQKTLNTIPDHELFLAYKSFLIRIAEAQLARLYAQSDRSGARIHRNIRDCLNDSRIFVLRRDIRGVVLYPLQLDPMEHLGSFPHEELTRRFLQEVNSRDSIPRMLESLSHVLADRAGFRRTIPLVDVVLMFKGVYQGEFAPEESVDHPWSLNELSEFELRGLRHEVENALKEKILMTYLLRGKISDKQARAMFNS